MDERDREKTAIRDTHYPLVSFVIPAYNAGKLILETVNSILNQSYAPIEVIVVDDGSKDNTGEVLASLTSEGRIRYIRQENQGQAAARKRGFEEAKGNYISFIDADDLIAPEKTGLQVAYLENNPECGVVYSDIYHFWHHKQDILLRKKLHYYSGQIFDELLREGNLIQVMTALIRRKVLTEYGLPGAKFRRSDDWCLWLNLAYHRVEFYFMDRVLAFQRRQKEGTLSDQKSYFKETAETNIAIYEHYKKLLSIDEIKKYGIEGLINFWQYRRAIGFIILGEKNNTREALRQFKSYSPKDAVKKVFLMILLAVFPITWLARIIFALREWKKRRSFEEVKDKSIRLPDR